MYIKKSHSKKDLCQTLYEPITMPLADNYAASQSSCCLRVDYWAASGGYHTITGILPIGIHICHQYY